MDNKYPEWQATIRRAQAGRNAGTVRRRRRARAPLLDALIRLATKLEDRDESPDTVTALANLAIAYSLRQILDEFRDGVPVYRVP